MYYIYSYDFPIGRLRLAGDEAGLTRILFPGQPQPEGGVEAEAPLLRQAARELNEYFAGKRKDFTVLLHPSGTPFQKAVWAALQTIPYGHTASYQDIAAKLGNPKAAIAVGQANRRNPLPILIPCHRVLASDGSLGGYSLGLERKRRLLKLEQTHFQDLSEPGQHNQTAAKSRTPQA